jgi:PAS domain S-box-containing protein
MPQPATLREASILVVDDREIDARLVETFLVGAGYTRVERTCEPRDVARLHAEKGYDLIILDLLMPEMDGFEVMESLAGLSDKTYLPILAVTGEAELMARALESGAKDFVAKPLRSTEVLARVHNLLETGALMKELRRRGEVLEESLAERTAALEESEKIFRFFATHVPVGIFVRGVEEMTYRYVNPAFETLAGVAIAAGDRIDNVMEAIHPEDRDVVRGTIRKLARGGADLEMRFVHSNGPERWARVRTFPIADASGTIGWVGGISEDITERRATENALRETESRFRALVEQSIVGIYVADEGRFTYANPRLCEMFGRTLEELRSIEVDDLILDEDVLRLWTNRARAIAGDPAALVDTYRFRRADGSILHLAVEGRIIEMNARNVVFGVGHDVSEQVGARERLRESEEKYRLLWETTTDAVVLVDEAMGITYANPSVREIFGYSPQELEGEDIELLQPERLRETHRAALARSLATREKRLDWKSFETFGLRRDGSEFPLEMTFSHLIVGDKPVFAAFMRNITQRKQATSDLEDANRRLHILSKRMLDIQEQERRTISRELHDDVGQSLLALRMGLHRLQGHVDEREKAVLEHCSSVSDAIQEKLHELSVQLLPPQLEQLGLPDALQWLVSRQRALTGLAIVCRLGFHGRSPVEIESACYRICQEALSNATRHSHAGVIEVELDADGESLILTVRDDGVGFDHAAERKDALMRGSLGLISMEERASLAGGRMEMRAVPGRGTTVNAFFPLGSGAEIDSGAAP